jgi:hypothetical protein
LTLRVIISGAAILIAALFVPLQASALSGNGQTVFKDVPVAPGGFPDYTPAAFVIKGGPNARPQAFNYAVRSDRPSVYRWYVGRLPQLSWHIQQLKRDYPRRGVDAIIADRAGEAVTIMLLTVRNGTRVNIVKFVSAK